MKMYFLNKKGMREFNRKYLKRSKNRKEGFQVLVSNGNYEVNLSNFYPIAMREWMNSEEFQDVCMAKFLVEIKKKD